MKNDDEKNINTDGGEESGGEFGGETGGKIYFRFKDAATLSPRDDVLPESEIRRLLQVHKDLHKSLIDKQKLSRKERAALKEGKLHFSKGYQPNSGFGDRFSRFKVHPVSKFPQFSGMDKQTIGLPTEFDANTNMDLYEKLENRFTQRFVPRFNPKLRPRGG